MARRGGQEEEGGGGGKTVPTRSSPVARGGASGDLSSLAQHSSAAERHPRKDAIEDRAALGSQEAARDGGEAEEDRDGDRDVREAEGVREDRHTRGRFLTGMHSTALSQRVSLGP